MPTPIKTSPKTTGPIFGGTWRVATKGMRSRTLLESCPPSGASFIPTSAMQRCKATEHVSSRTAGWARRVMFHAEDCLHHCRHCFGESLEQKGWTCMNTQRILPLKRGKNMPPMHTTWHGWLIHCWRSPSSLRSRQCHLHRARCKWSAPRCPWDRFWSHMHV